MHLLQEIKTGNHDIQFFIFRLDQLHPGISGNKYFKLKHNLVAAKEQGRHTLLTYGGAFSNHIAATAQAGREYGFKTIGVIRGEESSATNPTLSLARQNGMQLHFISREEYKRKSDHGSTQQLHEKFGDFYLIPEGGSNSLAVKGCREICSHIQIDFDYICCAVGTGGTLAGISSSLKDRQSALGFGSLKGGEFLKGDVKNLILESEGERNFRENFSVQAGFHFGGYAKITPELIEFKKSFESQHGIELDYIYTAKMMFGVIALISQGYFKKGSTIVAVHTGGVQGNAGFRL
jgi:1-aminocyclopropane-1-carboxylate deaminase